MKIKFHKMHGLGNDFAIFDEHISVENIKKLANRNTGIGFDQALIISKPTNPKELNYVRVFNADGSKAAFCGNGFRCIAWLLATENSELAFNTDSGTILTKVHKQNVTIRFPQQAKITPLHFKFGSGLHIDIGNQHLVFNNPMNFDALVQKCLSEYQNDINIFNIINEESNKLDILCYERGAGYTQACGSGACAVAWSKMYYNDNQQSEQHNSLEEQKHNITTHISSENTSTQPSHNTHSSKQEQNDITTHISSENTSTQPSHNTHSSKQEQNDITTHISSENTPIFTNQQHNIAIHMPGGKVQMYYDGEYMWQTGPIEYVFEGLLDDFPQLT